MLRYGIIAIRRPALLSPVVAVGIIFLAPEADNNQSHSKADAVFNYFDFVLQSTIRSVRVSVSVSVCCESAQVSTVL